MKASSSLGFISGVKVVLKIRQDWNNVSFNIKLPNHIAHNLSTNNYVRFLQKQKLVYLIELYVHSKLKTRIIVTRLQTKVATLLEI